MRKGLAGFAVEAARSQRKETLLLGGAVVLTAALRVAFPWPVKWIFDAATSIEGQTAVALGVAAASIVVISAVALYSGWRIRGTILDRIDEVLERVRDSLYGVLQFMTDRGLSYDAESASNSIRHLRNLTKGLERGIGPFALHSITISLMVVVMLVLNWKLGLLATFMLPLYWFPTPGMVKGIERRVEARRDRRAPRPSRRHSPIRFFVGATTRLVMALGIATLLWLGAGMVMNDMLSIGQLSVFLAYLVLARAPMIDLQKAATSLVSANKSREQIDRLLLALDIEAPMVAKRFPPPFEGRIAFNNVVCDFDGDSIDDVTLKLRPNRRVAFTGGDVGSRLILQRLLLRLSEPLRGRILIDGSDVEDYDETALRSQISAVPADGVVMDATIAEYITDGRRIHDEGAIKGALSQVELLDWVEDLPEGIHTGLNEYVDQLTRGKRRLLGMARAVYRKSPILLIDRPTLGLDEEEKRAMVIAIDRISRNRTTLINTDDLRIASRFEFIVYIEDGRVIEQGSHDELIDAEGAYADLFQRTSPGPVLYATKPVQLTAIYEDRREPENINPFVFLVGCPGSGVSLIEQMLEGHPMMAVTSESHFIPTVLQDAGARSDVPLTDDLVDRTRTFPNFDRLGLDNIEIYKAGGMSETYAEFVTELYNIFARKKDRELVAVKAPVYCRDIRLLHDLFPWARFIHVVRDGRDVAMSVLERATRLKEVVEATNVDAVPVGASALWWKTMVETARRDGNRLGNRFYHEVRFEDLVQQPQVCARDVGAFLELPNGAKLSEQVVSFASLDSVSNGFQDWRSQMNRSDVALFEALAGETLESMGYGRGMAKIPDDVAAEAQKCLASWRTQRDKNNKKIAALQSKAAGA